MMIKQREYFYVQADEYVSGKDYGIVRPASLKHPKNNAVMFIIEEYIDQAAVFSMVKDCLIFWPEGIQIPTEIELEHAVYPCEKPHTEYCRFFQKHDIKNLPKHDTVDFRHGAYISPEAQIGARVTIMPGVYIGADCVIGDDAYIGCGTKLMGEVIIGNRVVIRENTVIGADGLTTDRDDDGHAVTMPQFGSVILENDVQIGANTVIARGAIDETRICRGAKIDNSAFISHNVFVGEDTFVVGETIMFGSSSVGSRSMISGNATIRNGIHIGDQAIVGMGAVVVKPVAESTVVKGNPAK